MPTSTISQHARIGALLGVLMTVLAGSAIVLMHNNSHPATTPPPASVQQPTPHETVHVVPPTVNPLLPGPVRRKLEYSRRVVVGFYNPHSPVDQLTIAEARAAAAATHVPFVAVNLLEDSVAGPLTALLPSGELLPNPGLVIYRRPGTVVYRSDGYLNRTGVTQAVKDTK